MTTRTDDVIRQYNEIRFADPRITDNAAAASIGITPRALRNHKHAANIDRRKTPRTRSDEQAIAVEYLTLPAGTNHMQACRHFGLGQHELESILTRTGTHRIHRARVGGLAMLPAPTQAGDGAKAPVVKPETPQRQGWEPMPAGHPLSWGVICSGLVSLRGAVYPGGV